MLNVIHIDIDPHMFLIDYFPQSTWDLLQIEASYGSKYFPGSIILKHDSHLDTGPVDTYIIYKFCLSQSFCLSPVICVPSHTRICKEFS